MASSQQFWPVQVYVIIYGDGEAAPAGIYTLQTDQEHDSLPTDTIIAFESMSDAQRYSTASIVQTQA